MYRLEFREVLVRDVDIGLVIGGRMLEVWDGLMRVEEWGDKRVKGRILVYVSLEEDEKLIKEIERKRERFKVI